MNKIITLLISISITVSVFSQTKFFIEAGINSSAPAFEGELYDTSPKEARNGFTFSASIVNKLGHGFQFHNRVSFIRKNFQDTIFYGFGGTNDYHLLGLQYHALIEKDLLPKKKFHIFPTLGAYTTFHTSGTLDYKYSGLAGSRKLNLDRNPEFSKWDAGLSAGARFQWKKISLGSLFDIGLVKTSPAAEGKWSSVHFTLGYFFK